MSKSERNTLRIDRLVVIALIICAGIGTIANCLAAGPSHRPSSQTLRSMARVYIAFGDYEKAQPLASEALEMAIAQTAEESELAMCFIDMGTVCQYRCRLDDARQMLARGIELQRSCLGPMHPYIAYSLRMLASVYRQQSQFERAQTALDEAMHIMLDTHEPDETSMSTFLTEQAKLFCDQDRLDEAYAIYQNALDTTEKAYGPGHLCTANILEEIALLELRRDNLETARELVDRTIMIRSRYYGANHPVLVSTLLTKARICTAAGDHTDSDRSIAEAIKAADKIRNPIRLARLHEQIEQIRNTPQIAKL
jgi:tetratricopeptide (TPR) repeat protein